MPSSNISYTNKIDIYTTSAGGSHSSRVKVYSLSLTASETSYDVSANTSTIQLTGVFKIEASGWDPAFTSQTVKFTTKDSEGNVIDTKSISSAYYGTNYSSCNVTLTVPHNSDGTKNITYTTTLTRDSNNWYMPTNNSTVSVSGGLTSIPRMTSFDVTPVLSTGMPFSIVLGEVALQTYVHDLYWIVNDVRTNIWTKLSKSSGATATIPWGLITSIIGTNVTKKVQITLETFYDSSSSIPMGSITKEVTACTGKIPFSGYDNGLGDVGVTLGAKATSSGFNSYLPAKFSLDGGITLPDALADYVVEQGTSGDWTYSKWASGKAECWCKLSATVSTWYSWGSFYYGSPVVATPNYPANLFTVTPAVLAALSLTDNKGNALRFITTASDETYAKPSNYQIISSANSTKPSYSVSLHAIGRWV